MDKPTTEINNTIRYPGLEALKNYWFIFGAIITFIVGYTNVQNEVARLRVNAESQEAVIQTIVANQLEVSKQLASISQAISGLEGSGGMVEDVSLLQKDVLEIKLKLAKEKQ